ncbi:MAG TPA: hypothetical protein PLF42_07720, partial [Anaerolineales bacterium]|nr:hypothetical protein [Anaerolineales bacterium]
MVLEATTQTIVREISADLETPISVYMKLRGGMAPSFLLESVEGGERIARYSFIGVQPRAQYILRDTDIEIKDENGTSRSIPVGRTTQYEGDPTLFLQNEMSRFNFKPQTGVPRFIGGLVGYLGYESVRFFEPTLNTKMKRWSSSPVQVGAYRDHIPDGIFLLADTVIAFDHA